MCDQNTVLALEKLMGPFGIGDDAWAVRIDCQNSITAVLPEEVP